MLTSEHGTKTRLTSLLGIADGFVEGEADGLLLGLFEGDRLGLDVGCETFYICEKLVRS